MINTFNGPNKLCLVFFLLLALSKYNLLAQENKFTINKPKIPTQSQTKEKPLFDLLDSNQPIIQESNSTRWGNNPFFKRQPSAKKQLKLQSKNEPQEINFFEYKVDAIWKINKEYKALISGHIVKKGDKINDLVIIKISKDNIDIKRSNRKKNFRLGTIFYDFQI